MINKEDVIETKDFFAVKVKKDYFLVGHKGKSFLEQGYVWAPYAPLYVSPTLIAEQKIIIDPIKRLMRKIGYDSE